jgi:hypothetical protein
MCRTDIENYYPSVDLERVHSLFQDAGCLPAAFLVLKIYRQWQQRGEVEGLPVGPEASGVIGNFFLHPVDKLLEANGHEHLRWCDDILTFGPTISRCQDSIAFIDEALLDLRLKRSVQKTQSFDNVYDARANLKDSLIASLTDFQALDRDFSREAIRTAYDSRIRAQPDVEKRRFNYIVGRLLKHHDSYGCKSLVSDPELMNINPKLSGVYLGAAGLKDTPVIEAMMDRLSKPQEDRFDALDLHLLRALQRGRFGDAEAKTFRAIATNSARRWPIRVYGWAAYSNTTQHYREVAEAAREETIPQLRRGMITNLKGRARRPFLEHVQTNFPECRYTVKWLQAG